MSLPYATDITRAEVDADWLTSRGFPTDCPDCGMDLTPDMVRSAENPRLIVCDDCDWSWIA